MIMNILFKKKNIQVIGVLQLLFTKIRLEFRNIDSINARKYV